MKQTYADSPAYLRSLDYYTLQAVYSELAEQLHSEIDNKTFTRLNKKMLKIADEITGRPEYHFPEYFNQPEGAIQ